LTTRNFPLSNGTITVLKITLLHGVSIITNFVIPKRDKKNKKKETSHFFVYSRRATDDTWHGDRGGPSHFCTPLTFFDPISIVSPLGAIKNLWENAPTTGKCI